MTAFRRAIAQILTSEDDFLVVSHEGPDGDAIGSTVAMGYVLQALGKRFMLYNPSGMPEHFDWLRVPGPVHSSLTDLHDFTPRWVIVLDCGDPFRMGKELLKAIEPENIINIDHHVGNPMFGAVNWVESTMAAVGEMVGLLVRDLELSLDGGLGEAIYLAIVSDTGNFSYGNTKPEIMELAAEIMRAGLDAGDFNAKYQNQWQFRRINLWSEVLGAATLYCRGQVSVVRISQEVLERYEATPADCEGLVEFMRRVKTVRVSISLREERKNMIKFSLRSHGPDNVQRVALQFSGGGHRNAAGGLISDSMANAEQLLLAAVGRIMGICAPEYEEGRDA